MKKITYIILGIFLTLPTLSFSQTSCQRKYTEQDVKNVQNRMDVMKIMAMNGKKFYDPNFTKDAQVVFSDNDQYQKCLKEEQIRGNSQAFRKYNDNSLFENQKVEPGSVLYEMQQNQQRMNKEYLSK